MWFKFKNVARLIIETLHLLLLTVLLGNPFNVKHIDDIVVMASTAKTTLASIMANSGVGGGAKLTTSPASSTSSSEAAPPTTLLPASLLLLETAGAKELYNSTTFQRTFERSDSTEIDSMNDEDSDSNYESVVLKNYVRTKHIALFDHTTGVETRTRKTKTNTEAGAGAGATAVSRVTTLISPIGVTTPIATETRTTKNPTSSTKSTTASSSPSSPWSSSLSSLMSSIEIDHQRFHLNKTQLDVLSSLSLLSLNDTLTPPPPMATTTTTKTTKTKLKSSASVVSASASTSVSTLTFPNHEAATALRQQQGNEQNMHNTNSHLTADNANATIVSSSAAARTSSSASSSSSSSSALTVTTIPTKIPLHNTSTMTKGSSSSSGSGSSGGSSSILSNGSTTTTGNNSSRLNTGTGTTRISARKVDSKYLLSKSHKTDAPMLNYIFDTFSSANKHHHHDQRYGPHFEDVQLVGAPTNMTVQAGSSIHLNCRISLLQDKTVSWVRRNAQGENALDLLTVGLHAYTGDKRYKMEFQYPSNWRLKINNVKKDDEATYECQISTHPPRVIQINLHVNAPKVMIVDEFGDPLQEKYYEQDSTLQLSCVVRNVAMSTSVVYWKHSEDVLNYDVTRGGVSVKTELMDDGANSTLFIAKINKADSGNYTCSISEYQNYTIVVHILNGESFAELHHGSAKGWQQLNHQTWKTNLILATVLLLLLPAYIHR